MKARWQDPAEGDYMPDGSDDQDYERWEA